MRREVEGLLAFEATADRFMGDAGFGDALPLGP